jgi:hypothetical protein
MPLAGCFPDEILIKLWLMLFSDIFSFFSRATAPPFMRY